MKFVRRLSASSLGRRLRATSRNWLASWSSDSKLSSSAWYSITMMPWCSWTSEWSRWMVSFSCLVDSSSRSSAVISPALSIASPSKRRVFALSRLRKTKSPTLRKTKASRNTSRTIVSMRIVRPVLGWCYRTWCCEGCVMLRVMSCTFASAVALFFSRRVRIFQ